MSLEKIEKDYSKRDEEIAIEHGYFPDNYYMTAREMMHMMNKRAMCYYIIAGGRRY